MLGVREIPTALQVFSSRVADPREQSSYGHLLTIAERLRRGIEVGAANSMVLSMVLRITQVGTLSEALGACRLALASG